VHRFVNGEGSGALQDGAEGVDLSPNFSSNFATRPG
jgi:hypothetical protein